MKHRWLDLADHGVTLQVAMEDGERRLVLSGEDPADLDQRAVRLGFSRRHAGPLSGLWANENLTFSIREFVSVFPRTRVVELEPGEILSRARPPIAARPLPDPLPMLPPEERAQPDLLGGPTLTEPVMRARENAAEAIADLAEEGIEHPRHIRSEMAQRLAVERASDKPDPFKVALYEAVFAQHQRAVAPTTPREWDFIRSFPVPIAEAEWSVLEDLEEGEKEQRQLIQAHLDVKDEVMPALDALLPLELTRVIGNPNGRSLEQLHGSLRAFHADVALALSNYESAYGPVARERFEDFTHREWRKLQTSPEGNIVLRSGEEEPDWKLASPFAYAVGRSVLAGSMKDGIARHFMVIDARNPDPAVSDADLRWAMENLSAGYAEQREWLATALADRERQPMLDAASALRRMTDIWADPDKHVRRGASPWDMLDAMAATAQRALELSAGSAEPNSTALRQAIDLWRDRGDASPIDVAEAMAGVASRAIIDAVPEAEAGQLSDEALKEFALVTDAQRPTRYEFDGRDDDTYRFRNGRTVLRVKPELLRAVALDGQFLTYPNPVNGRQVRLLPDWSRREWRLKDEASAEVVVAHDSPEYEIYKARYLELLRACGIQVEPDLKWRSGVLDAVLNAAVRGVYNSAVHPDNKASRQLFAEITGLRLPDGVRATMSVFTGQPFHLRLPTQREDQPSAAPVPADVADPMPPPPAPVPSSADDEPAADDALFLEMKQGLTALQGLSGGTPMAVAKHAGPGAVRRGHGFIGNGHITLREGIVPAFDAAIEKVGRQVSVHGPKEIPVAAVAGLLEKDFGPQEAVEWRTGVTWSHDSEPRHAALGLLPDGRAVAISGALFDFARRHRVEIRGASPTEPLTLWRGGERVGVVAPTRFDQALAARLFAAVVASPVSEPVRELESPLGSALSSENGTVHTDMSAPEEEKKVEAVPPAVLDRVRHALKPFQEAESAIAQGRALGPRYEAEVFMRTSIPASAIDVLGQFRCHAAMKGIDHQAVVDSLGGLPPLRLGADALGWYQSMAAQYGAPALPTETPGQRLAATLATALERMGIAVDVQLVAAKHFPDELPDPGIRIGAPGSPQAELTLRAGRNCLYLQSWSSGSDGHLAGDVVIAEQDLSPWVLIEVARRVHAQIAPEIHVANIPVEYFAGGQLQHADGSESVREPTMIARPDGGEPVRFCRQGLEWRAAGGPGFEDPEAAIGGLARSVVIAAPAPRAPRKRA